MPDALLDEVTALVEWPAVYAGTLRRGVPRSPAGMPDPDHAAEPEILRAERTPTAGSQNRFLLVSNLETARSRGDHPGQRARAARAACRRQVLLRPGPQGPGSNPGCPGSRSIVYHNKLGTQGQRVRRLRTLVAPDRRRRSAPTRTWPIAPPCSPRPISSPTWSANFPSCRAPWAATTRSTTARRRSSPTRSSSTTGRASPATICPQAPSRRRCARRQARDAGRPLRHRPDADRRQGPVRPAPQRHRRPAHPDRGSSRSTCTHLIELASTHSPQCPRSRRRRRTRSVHL